MEDEPREYPTMEAGPSMCIAILDDPAKVGAAILDDGSHENSTILKLGKVVVG